VAGSGLAHRPEYGFVISTHVMIRAFQLLAAALLAVASTTAQDLKNAPDAQNAPPAPDAEAAPDSPDAADASRAADPLEASRPDPAELVRALGSEIYKEREAASAALWDLGDAGLKPLRKASSSNDPEVAHRARRLVRRIQTGITPETPQKVVDLVERYFRSGLEAKKAALEQLKDLDAFSHVLRLYRFEENPEVREECLEVIKEVVLPAVRQELANGDFIGAKAVLELAPMTDDNMRRRAALSRVCGTSAEDLVAADIAGDDPWRLALLREKGDLPAALALAEKLGRDDLVGSLALFDGNPVPYLNWYAADERNPPTMRLHAEMVRDRWMGEEQRAAKLAKSLAKNVNDESEDQRSAVISLMLNGYLDLALPMLRKNDDFRDFLYAYYETVEDPVRAIAVHGYEGTDKEKRRWIEERLGKLEENLKKGLAARDSVLTVASFLMARGEREQAVEIAGKIGAIIKRDGGMEEWLEFLGELGDMSGPYHELAFALAADEMGDEADDDEAAAVINVLFREGDIARRHWERLKAEKDLSAGERMLLLAGIYGLVEMPAGEVGAVLKCFEEEAMALEGEDRRQALADLVEPADYRDDAGAVLALLEQLAEIDGVGRLANSLGIYYGYMGRWDKAAESWELALEANPDARQTMATLAAVRMRLGQHDKARELLAKPELFALNEPGWLRSLAGIFEMRNLYGPSEDYLRRLLITNSPSSRSRDWISACAEYARYAKDHRQWRVAAAFMEIEALYDIRDRATYVNPVIYLRKRFGADLMRGLALHEEGKDDDARALFDRSFRILLGDVVLADDFFPFLREAGFTAEHDRYFEEAYARVEASIKAYPRTHNTYNSAAWLASRAMRRIDDAERMVAKALEMRPRQAAYLDTMAEVWFARRDRAKALEWSRKAVADSENAGHSRTGGAELRQQLERFEKGDFPVP
jgi:tetratricopeptide (TPR) repeat protein